MRRDASPAVLALPQAQNFQAEIKKQMQQRAAQAALRKQRAQQSSRYRRQEDSSGEGSDDGRHGHHPLQQQLQQQKPHDRAPGGLTKSKPEVGRGGADPSDGSSSEDEVRRKYQVKRKKPRFM
jgi:hypothetical protein